MTPLTAAHRTILKEAVRRTVGPSLRRLWLVGSHAKRTAVRSSDLDILVDAGAPMPARMLTALTEELEESTLPWQVDIVDYHLMVPKSRDAMLVGAELICEGSAE